MSEPFVFDSRYELCKSPYGAVLTGTAVTLHTRPLLRDGFVRCTLLLHEEFAGLRRELEMTPGPKEDDRIRFDLVLDAPAQPELVWYHFRFEKQDGTAVPVRTAP